MKELAEENERNTLIIRVNLHFLILSSIVCLLYLDGYGYSSSMCNTLRTCHICTVSLFGFDFVLFFPATGHRLAHDGSAGQSSGVVGFPLA